MDDTQITARWVEYNQLRHKRGGAIPPRSQKVRVFRTSPERVVLQMRNENHYMTATLDADQAAAVIAALTAGFKEIDMS